MYCYCASGLVAGRAEATAASPGVFFFGRIQKALFLLLSKIQFLQRLMGAVAVLFI